MDHRRSIFVTLACVLLGFGTLMVYSSSITSWPTEFESVYLSRHLLFLAVAVATGVVCAALPKRFWFDAAPYLFWGTVLLLVAVLIPGLGTRVNGAQRWLRFGPLSMQPSELAKIALPLFVCRILCQRKEHLAHWRRGTLPLVAPLLVLLPLTLLQPDLGTSVFLACGCAIVLFLGGWPIRNFLVSGAVAAPALAGLLILRPYQLRRVTGFLSAISDWNEAPYQLKQSLISLGAGGVLGVGLGRGWQKLSFLPEANTDFVYAVVGEEMGLIATLGLLVVWAGLFYSGWRMLSDLDQHDFAWLAGFTLLTQIVLQAGLNMAVVTALVPPKGIPHPLISYGGSNLVVTVAALGIIISLSRPAESGVAANATVRPIESPAV
ncbi:MAG: FtsW/RodA/SpoVE family cell cycle protein [Planctomycetaceae bacterium]|nr:FtsW/RodA/SpoVE family cell cycle protein [Planctomycetaceae bacterium]